METKEIIDEIMKLSIKKRPQIIEKTAKTIQRDDEKEQMKKRLISFMMIIEMIR